MNNDQTSGGKLLRARALCAVCLVALVLSGTASAHPYHISLAEMEYNAESGRYEVSLKVQITDIELALAAHGKRKIDLENIDLETDTQSKKLIEDYLNANFFLVSAQYVRIQREDSPEVADEAPRSNVRFVGKELKATWLWLYFELEPPPGQTKLGRRTSEQRSAEQKAAPEIEAPSEKSGEPADAEQKALTGVVAIQSNNEPPRSIDQQVSKMVLFNKVLLDVTEGQINTTTLRVEDRRTSFKTTFKKVWFELP